MSFFRDGLHARWDAIDKAVCIIIMRAEGCTGVWRRMARFIGASSAARRLENACRHCHRVDGLLTKPTGANRRGRLRRLTGRALCSQPPSDASLHSGARAIGARGLATGRKHEVW